MTDNPMKAPTPEEAREQVRLVESIVPVIKGAVVQDVIAAFFIIIAGEVSDNIPEGQIEGVIDRLHLDLKQAFATTKEINDSRKRRLS